MLVSSSFRLRLSVSSVRKTFKSARFCRCTLASSANSLRLMAISVGSVLWLTCGPSPKLSRYSNTSQNSATNG
ncbi:hypothetical protein D3C76_1617690 [compost metagenome]